MTSEETIIKMVEDAWWRMSRGPEKRVWQPPATELNPGTIKPQNQALHGLPAIDQTMSVLTRRGGIVDSNGQVQMPNLRPFDGVRSTEGAAMNPRHFNGETQLKNLRAIDQGVSASAGTSPAVDVDVSSQNFHLPPTLPALTDIK